MIALEDAIALAARLHKNQVDKQGEPYILHPLRVMQAVPDYLRVLAVLHDVLEDCPITAASLRPIVDDDWTVHRLSLLTKVPGEGRAKYIERVCQFPEAVVVKCADICDNLKRVDGLDPAPSFRLRQKYHRDFEQIADWYMGSFSQGHARTPELMDTVFNAVAEVSRVVRESVGLSLIGSDLSQG